MTKTKRPAADLSAVTAGHRYCGAIQPKGKAGWHFNYIIPRGDCQPAAASPRIRAALDIPARHEEPRQQYRHYTACRGLRSTSEALATNSSREPWGRRKFISTALLYHAWPLQSSVCMLLIWVATCGSPAGARQHQQREACLPSVLHLCCVWCAPCVLCMV